MDVLNRRLADSSYVSGDNYTIANMAIWSWYGALVKGHIYEAGGDEFACEPIAPTPRCERL